MRKKVEPKPTGRPKAIIDYDTVDKLCELQCTGEEIASVLGIDYDTLNTHCKTDKGFSFSEYFEIKRKAGKVSLRRYQFTAAQLGNPTMLIWLGKQYLGQRDMSEVEHTGRIELTAKYDLSKLTAKELDELERLSLAASCDSE